MEQQAFRIVDTKRKVAIGYDRHNPDLIFWVPLKSVNVREFANKHAAQMHRYHLFKEINTIGLAIEPVFEGRKIEEDIETKVKTRLRGLGMASALCKNASGEQFYSFTKDQFLTLMQSVSKRPLKLDKP